ncbi:flagellar protein FlhE [Vreelandella aquamarina]
MPSRQRMKRRGIVCLLALLWFPASAMAATGSWVASVPGMMVAMSDRFSETQRVTPPPDAPVQGRSIGRVQWRWEHPPGQPVNAWLCHPAGCLAVPAQRGSTQAFEGASASAPLHFRFTLPQGQRPVRIQGMQVIVNYQ